MHVDRQGVGLAASLGLVGLGCFADWFEVSEGGLSLLFGLRGAEVCVAGTCRAAALPADLYGGVFTLFASLAFYVGVGLIAVMAFALVTRVGFASGAPFLYGTVRLGSLAFFLGAVAAFLSGNTAATELELGFPAALLGAAVGFASSFGGELGSGLHAERSPRRRATLPPAPAPVRRAPGHDLRFVVAHARPDVAGLAVRSTPTGAERAVPWSEIVRVVARQLPPGPPHEQAILIDLVQASGVPLRVLSTTRLDLRALPVSPGMSTVRNDLRRLVAFARAKNPSLAVEPASGPFFAGHSDPMIFATFAEFLAYDRAIG